MFGGCTNKMVSTKWKTCTTHGGKGYCKYTEPGGDIVLGKLLERAQQERRWLSYSIGPSNWNGPTLTSGMLPKELQPFSYDMMDRSKEGTVVSKSS